MSSFSGVPMNNTTWWLGNASSLVLMPESSNISEYINNILTTESSENNTIQIPNTYAVWLSLYLKQVVDTYNTRKYQFNNLYHFSNYPAGHIINGVLYLGDTTFTNSINDYFKQQTGQEANPNFSERLYRLNMPNLQKRVEDDPSTPDIDETEYYYDDHYLVEWYYTDSNWDRKEGHLNAPEIPYIMNIDASIVDPAQNEELASLLSSYINWMKACRQLIIFQQHFNARQVTITSTPLLGIKLSENIDKRHLYYSQCMITNKGGENECWSDEYSDERVTISLADIWAFSGLYKAIDFGKYANPETRYLSREDAIIVINTIKNYTGPYFADVMDKMITLMYEVEEALGEDNCSIIGNRCIIKRKVDDYRVMPYDVNSMTDADKTNFTIVDPRVKLYTDTFVGGLVSEFTFKLNLGVYIKIQPVIVNLAGKLTEYSVFFQQLINFETFENWGLSPASMWQNAFVTIVLLALVLIFILKTTSATIKYLLGKGGSIVKIISMFLVLFIELGLFTAISIDPEKSWNIIKTNVTRAINIGEQLILSDNELQYLFGSGDDRDPATAYYLPYLDAWSIYNTGYGLFSYQQIIENTPTSDSDDHDDVRERWGLFESGDNANWPKIKDNKIEHWSILLLDSFEYHGDNYSLLSIKDEDGRWVNGKRINNNAYRVVDHFLAPRISLTKTNDKITLTTTQNENYNGQFQSGFITLLTKLLNVILILCLSIIKFLIFIWLWYQLYIFLFKVILARGGEKKSWKDILIDVFSPILGMIVLGAYVGLCIRINAYLVGIIGLLAEVGLFIVTAIIIRWWSNKPKIFPKTLLPIAALLNMKQTKRKYEMRKSAIESENEARRHGDTDEHDINDPVKDREYYFDESNNIRDKFRTRERQKEIESWIKRVRIRAESGITISDKDKAALLSYMRYTRQEGKYDFETFKEIDKKSRRDQNNQTDN